MIEIIKRLVTPTRPELGRFVGRRFTRDVAITFRMGAGQPGDVNRTHPASIPPFLIDPTNPITFYGQPGLINPTSSGLRALLSSDTAVVDIDAIAVRPYPIQVASATNYGAQALGSGAVPPAQPLDGLVSGYIMVQLPAGQSPQKGGEVFIWIAASSGAHVQGGFEASSTGGSTFAISGNDKTQFNSGADAFGVAEIGFNI